MNTITIVVPAADHRVGGRETIPRWSDLSRLALGAWTFSMPLLALAIASASLVLRPAPALLAAAMALVSGHAIITMLYGAFAVQNPRIARWRTAWLLALLVAGPVFIPVYWVVHVWRAPRVGRPNVDEPSPASTSSSCSRTRRDHGKTKGATALAITPSVRSSRA